MPSTPLVSRIVASRQNRREQRQRRAGQRAGLFLRGVLLIVSVFLVLGVMGATAAYAGLTQGLPSIEELPVLLDPPNGLLLQPTRLYDRTGQIVLLELESPAIGERRYLPLNEIPPHFILAVLASQEPDYWDSGGFSFTNLEDTNPGIAERLVLNLLLWGEPQGAARTLRARLLASQALAQYGHQKVLEWYLNSLDFGQLAYGTDSASRVYFGKPPAELTLAEAALLAAAADAPALNPIDAPQVAIEHQSNVLEAMLANGFITAEQALAANTLPLEIQPGEIPASLAPDFTGLALSQLGTRIPIDRLQRGGFQIITTLDTELQAQVACAAAAQIAQLSGDVASSPSSQDCPTARLLPSLPRDEPPALLGFSASVVVLDPRSGEVLALIGDPLAPHTPGSLLSPFVYLTAFTRGFSPASLVWDIPASLPASLSGYANPDGQFHGPARIRTALANDYVVPAVQVLGQIGAENVWRSARQSGLTSLEIPSGDAAYRLLFDEGPVNLLEAAHAFSMLANQGFLAGQSFQTDTMDELPPLIASALLKVSDYGNRVWLDFERPVSRAIVSAQLAYLITNILSDEAARQPSLGRPNPLEIGLPAAAKLGQTTTRGDTWAIGYTPQRVVGVWIGYPVETELTSPLFPLPAAGLWHAVLKTAQADLSVAGWQEPVGLTRLQVCDPSGLLATNLCPNIVTEIFLPGSEPVQLDNLYRSFLVNSQTGRLATVFTPPELVEEQVFLVVPPEAAAWAASAGLPTPPDTYDVIFNPSPSAGDAAITAPEIFAYISGSVPIAGRARGENFAFYRVQIGEGLNPRQWLQIGVDISTPVEDGQLMMWDTSGLNGLYAVQLLVVRQDQSIETATIQVTVDNVPPVLQILYPAEGQRFAYPLQNAITFQVQVSDDLGIQRVEFLVDGVSVSSLTQAPFAAPWEGGLGQHTLTVRATDLAGNVTETNITFVIER